MTAPHRRPGAPLDTICYVRPLRASTDGGRGCTPLTLRAVASES